MKRRLGYRWRLFLSAVAVVWLVMSALIGYQYYTEVNFRKQLIRDEMSMIDSRIIYAYERKLDLSEFLNFVKQYYANTTYSSIQISIYNAKDSLIASVGEPLPVNEMDDSGGNTAVGNILEEGGDGGADGSMVRGANGQKMFYYTAVKSLDGQISVRTAIPYNISVRNAVTVDSTLVWLFLLFSGMATVIVYLVTRKLGKNLEVLRNFSHNLETGIVEVDASKLPHDELGDIARSIINMYQARLEANDRSERERRIAIDAIEERNAMRRQMTNNINHELKTPLGVIRGYLDTIDENPNMDADTRNHFLTRARDNVERLCSLLNDVSTMTRLEDGIQNVQMAVVNMYELLEAVSSDVEASQICGDMKFHFSLPKDCVVLGNHNLLSGMILNLIRNAVFHSHGTEIHFRIISESAKYCLFAFFDNGSGVNDDHLAHLFERFYRVDSGRSRKVGGTGLGLPIVKETIVSLGGSISVHNLPSYGLSFLFTLKKPE